MVRSRERERMAGERLMNVYILGVARCRPASRSLAFLLLIPTTNINGSTERNDAQVALLAPLRLFFLFSFLLGLFVAKRKEAHQFAVLLLLTLGPRGFINCERASINNHSLSLWPMMKIPRLYISPRSGIMYALAPSRASFCVASLSLSVKLSTLNGALIAGWARSSLLRVDANSNSNSNLLMNRRPFLSPPPNVSTGSVPSRRARSVFYISISLHNHPLTD